MSHLLDPLDSGFLNALGHQGRLDQFAPLLEPADPETKQPVRRMRWQSGASPNQRIAVTPGALLMFQRTAPHAQPDQTQWGLHSITLHTALSPMSNLAWPDAWPANLPAEKTTLQDVTAAFGEPQVNMPGLAIFSLKGPKDQNWGLQCQFNETGHLQTFTLAHLDSWQPLPEIELEPVEETKPPEATPLTTCFSGGTVPMTGWYEGLLPPNHPSHASLSQLDARFVHREAGQRMSQLGVQPSRDEALVVWTWIGEELPKKNS